MDDSLALPFDLLVCGTGSVESMVAASAAYAGKRVLHTDGNPFYGGCDSTLPLPQFTGILQQHLLPSSSSSSSSVTTPLDYPPVQGFHLRALGEVPPLPSSLPPNKARRVLVDIRPRLLLAQGAGTSLLVASDASRYLSLRRMGSCYVLPSEGGGGGATSALRVPASKADIFMDGGLTLLEKRSVMRFLQMAMDGVAWGGEEGDGEEGESSSSVDGGGGATGGDGVTWLNETTLGNARSLLRPQNKVVGGGIALEAYQGGNLVEVLRTGCAMSPRVTQLTTAALALWDGGGGGGGGGKEAPLPTPLGMARVRSYLAALNRFGGTAMLTHEYGSGAVSEAYCRLAAVNGAIYMLGTVAGEWSQSDGGSGSSSSDSASAGGAAFTTPGTATPLDSDSQPLKDPMLTVKLVPSHLSNNDPPLTIRTRRALVSPTYAPPTSATTTTTTTTASSPPPGPLLVCCAVLDVSALGETWEYWERYTGSSSKPLTSSAASSSATSLHCVLPYSLPGLSGSCTVYILEQGEEDKVTPQGLRLFYAMTSLPPPSVEEKGTHTDAAAAAAAAAAATAGTEEEAGAALWALINSGRWWKDGGEGGKGDSVPPNSRLPTLLWHVTYTVSSGSAAVATDGVHQHLQGAAPLLTTPQPNQLPTPKGGESHSPWRGCVVHSEDFVECAQHAYGQLFPELGKLFSVKAAKREDKLEGGEAVDKGEKVGGEVEEEEEEEKEKEKKEEVGGEEKKEGALPTLPPVESSDLKDALSMLKDEPLDFL